MLISVKIDKRLKLFLYVNVYARIDIETQKIVTFYT